MKKMKKKMRSRVVALLLFTLMMSAFSAKQVQAAPKMEKTVNFWLYDKDPKAFVFVHIQNPTAKGRITKIENSNPSVVKVSAYMKYFLKVRIKSVGVSNVSFQYAGKSFKIKMKVQKWESPCKVFQIGNRNYAENFEKSEQYNLNRQKKDITAKISIVPKKDWKLLKIESFTSAMKAKKVKNNSNIKLKTKDTGTGVFVYFKNKNTGLKRRLYFGYSNSNMPNENIYNYRQ